MPTGPHDAVAAASTAAQRLRPPTGVHPALNRLAGLAARLLGTSSSQVSLLTDVQHVVGAAGRATSTLGSTGPLEDSLCTVTAGTRRPLAVTDAPHDDRVSSLPPVTSGQVGAYLGVPLTTERGEVVGALCVFDPQPRTWSEADLTLLGELADSVVAELELSVLSSERESRQLVWELAVDAAGVGTFDWDLASGRLTWDDRLMQLFGYDHETFDGTIEAFDRRVHPDDLGRVSTALQAAIDACGPFAAEYRVQRPDGSTRWVAARGRALGDESGHAVRFLGAAYDTTGARDSDARVSRVLETMTAAFFSLDRDWRFTYVNGHAESLLGKTREELIGGVIWELFPDAVGAAFETQYRYAMTHGEPTTFEAYYPDPLDAYYEVQAWPDPAGLSVYFLDITTRRAAQKQTDRAARRAELLAEVTSELAGTLDAERAVARLAEFVVPALADWCLVTLVDDPGAGGHLRLRDVGMAHVQPASLPVVERYAQLRFEALRDTAYLLRSLRTGEVVQCQADATPAIQEVLLPGEAHDLIAELAPDAFTVLPLRGRGRTVGLLTLFSGAERGPLPPDDLQTARDVAGRAGLALDSARLYLQQRELAEGLQRSLLTAPVEPDHMQIAVRYTPAAEAAQVGGDWYDAFLQSEGATVLVIGDVVGHDTAAAAAMGQMRTMLRTVAVHTGAGPAEVLRGVDAVMETLDAGVTATAVVARLEQTPEDLARGLTRLRWSNAGHPPPLVIGPDGAIDVLGGEEADLLLGIDPRSDRLESEVPMPWGATLLLFTDGLVERRGQSIDDGLRQLRSTLGELVTRDLTLDDLCDEVLSRMLPDRREDDVALVAVRLHPQDRPRPVEAGPNRVPPAIDDGD